MLDRSLIGYRSLPCTLAVERGRLRQFAHAIGETRPEYLDEAAARAAGYPDLPVLPTFLFCLEMDRPNPYGWFDDLGLPLPKVLHGNQAFHYHRMAFAGEHLTFDAEVSDVFSKKGGLLEFVVQDNRITDHTGAPVADFRRTLVIRHG